MSSSRPRAVLFDLDGTLIDSIQLILEAARHAFTANECDWPGEDEWLAGVGTPLAGMLARFAPAGAQTGRLLASYREYQQVNHDRLVSCYDDVADTVLELSRRGHQLAVVTSKSDELARRGLAHVGLLERFETVVSLDSCVNHKPHPEPVFTALERLGRDPSEAAFVGDSVHDIEAGNAAGVTTVAALWGPFRRHQLEPARPALFASRASDLLHLIR